MPNEIAHTPIDALTHDFLTWLAAAPRTHADVMEVWRSSCPRLTVWEDALSAGLVKVDGSVAPAQVKLTDAGRVRLSQYPSSSQSA